jgi:hypothetical protein
MRTGRLDPADMPRLMADYDTASRQAFAMAGPQFMGLFDLSAEPDALRESYGGEFGQRLLLSRRLVEGGVRFIEVSHNLGFINGTGWDTHNEGQLKQHLLIEELDKGLAALVTDLEARKLLDKTVIAVATEFGRPAQFDGGGGRGHHAKCFSLVLAGGGLKTGQAIGTSDELGMTPVADPEGDLAAGAIPPAVQERGESPGLWPSSFWTGTPCPLRVGGHHPLRRGPTGPNRMSLRSLGVPPLWRRGQPGSPG